MPTRRNPMLYHRWYYKTPKPVTFEVDLNDVDWIVVNQIAGKIKSLKDADDKVAMTGLFDEMLKAFGTELTFEDFHRGIYPPALPDEEED